MMQPQACAPRGCYPPNNCVQTSCVTFPVRGKCNPYFGFLLPLLVLTITAFILILLALISAVSIPINQTLFNSLNGNFQAVRTTAIILYAIAITITVIAMIVYLMNTFNCFDAKFTTILVDLMLLFAIGLLLPISILMIVAEATVPAAAFGIAVNQGAFLTAGILGLVAIVPLLAALFLSRFYEYCIGSYKNRKRECMEAAVLASKIRPCNI